MSTQRTVNRAKVAHAKPTIRATQIAKDARNKMRANYIGDISSCNRCPPAGMCPTCWSINKARIDAGLVRPRYMEVDHPNNILYPIPQATGRYPHHVSKGAASLVVTAHIRQLGGGWRQGLASLNGRIIYEGRKTRSMEEAWGFARRGVECIRAGLRNAREQARRG